MYKIVEKINKFKEVFPVNRIQAKPIAIEDAMSRTNQRFWRVKLDTGDTLYTYQGSTIKDIAQITALVPGQQIVPSTLLPHAQGQVCVFDIEQKGKYWHITASALGGQPTTAVVPGSTATQTTPGAVAPSPAAQPVPITGAEQTMADIATPQSVLPQPVVQAPVQAPAPTQVAAPAPTFTSRGDGKNAGVCMSYAKDLAVAGVITIDRLIATAELMFNWVETHK